MAKYELSNYWHETVNENVNLPARFEIVSDDAMIFPVHWHEYWELLLVDERRMHAVVQGESYDLQKGDILVVNPEEIHMTQTLKGTRYLMLQVNAKYFEPLFREISLPNYDNLIRADQTCIAIFYELAAILDEKKEGYSLLFTSKLYELFREIYLRHSSEETKNRNDSMTELLDWIKAHMKEDLTLKDAAEHLHVSREYFCRIFKKYTGQTFLEYLYALRTFSFYEDLKSSDDPIPLIMEQNGITNYKVFLRTFKQTFGDSPQRVRKNMVQMNEPY